MKRKIIIAAIAITLILLGFVSANLMGLLWGDRASMETQAEAGSSVSSVAKTLSPAIVGITSYTKEGDFFNQRTVPHNGSGVIVNANGYIVTNHHVIEDAERIEVALYNGKVKEARIIGKDARTDLALLKVDAGNLTPAKLGDSDKLVVGEGVVAIGNPLGAQFARSVTAGVVSGVNRLLTTEQGFIFRLIQTDAAINPGNSGGALANYAGEVIGINTIKISASGFEGMGFAIPSNQVKEVLEELRTQGRVVRPVAGLKIVNMVTPQMKEHFNLPVEFGLTVIPIKDGPAEKAGLKSYDIIQAVDGIKVKSVYDLQEIMFKHRAGEEVSIEVVRLPREQGEKMKLIKCKVKLDGDGLK